MIKIDNEKCIGCSLCAKDCFPGNIAIENGKASSGKTGCMDCGHCIAVCPKNAIILDGYNMSEVGDYNKENFDIEPENLLNFIKFRRSVRAFKDIPVENEKIERIIEAGRFTQTGGNRQPISYIVIRDEMPQLLTLALESLNEKADYMLNDKNQKNPVMLNYAKRWKDMYTSHLAEPNAPTILFFNAPIVILIVSDSPIDGGLASSNMELMTVAEGLGTFFSGFFVAAASGNQKIKKFLHIDNQKEVISCMVIGYPDVQYLRTVPRKPASIDWR